MLDGLAALMEKKGVENERDRDSGRCEPKA
jgi:hypothetical protein